MGLISEALGARHFASSQNFSDEVQRLAKDFAYRYSTSETNQKTLQYIASFIGIVKSKYPNVQYQSLFRSIVYAYEKNNLKYPEYFNNAIAMEYLDELNLKGTVLKNQSTEPTTNYNLQWFQQKSKEVENHLKHIGLIKLQLTKNLKDLQSQNGGHLWIDIDFIDPATETLQASLTQIQDLENRLQVLKLTYQDHL